MNSHMFFLLSVCFLFTIHFLSHFSNYVASS
uniref:Uncharacterized protein n=1 Tax=Rhizophora mucronata TaxID=61149 RepID=A0A2P2NGF7_RHIMU